MPTAVLARTGGGVLCCGSTAVPEAAVEAMLAFMLEAVVAVVVAVLEAVLDGAEVADADDGRRAAAESLRSRGAKRPSHQLPPG